MSFPALHSRKYVIFGLNLEGYLDFQQLLNIYKSYREEAFEKVNKIKHYINNLPQTQQELLSNYKARLDDLEDCLLTNNEFWNKILAKTEIVLVEHGESEAPSSDIEQPKRAVAMTEMYMIQLVREWSEMGAPERKASFEPIVQSVLKFFPPEERSPEDVKILLPGAGYGRLPFEIACKGYNVAYNDFQPCPLVITSFILNMTTKKNMFTIYPWATNSQGKFSMDHQMERVCIPDVCPKDCIREENARFSIIPGPFLQKFTQSNQWDCVATCFFIDCSQNVIDVVENIYKILKPGGIWINIGPLEYSFAENNQIFSIEPHFSILKEIIKRVGFSILSEREGIETPYGINTRDMAQAIYRSVFFECRKPLEPTTESKAQGTRLQNQGEPHHKNQKPWFPKNFLQKF